MRKTAFTHSEWYKKYFLLVGEYISCLNGGLKKKLKFEFLAELYAKQYYSHQKLGHVLTCKISCRGRYPALGHLVFFLNEKKIKNFRLMHIALFLEVTY